MNALVENLCAWGKSWNLKAWPSAVRAVFRHEWRQLVHAPLTPIFLTAFGLALAAAVFLVADFYATDVASMELLWTFLPWVALVLVPALSMRAFIDEPGDRGLEMVLTLPLPLPAVVIGKWLAGTGLLVVTLLFTLPFAATVAYLGAPDLGVMLSGYVGAALLLAMLLSVAFVPAALVRDQVGAYVLGVGLLLLLMLLDGGVRPGATTEVLPLWLAQALALAGPRHWFGRLAAGEVTLAAVGYFVVATALALWGTRALIAARRRAPLKPETILRGAGLGIAAVAAGLILVVLLQRIPATLDMTAQREFTLHAETRDIARRLPQDVAIDFYWSEQEAKVPASIRAHARRTRELLTNIVHLAGGRVTLREHDPRPDTEQEEAALAAGIRRVPMTSGDTFFLGATFRHGERQGTIQYFDIRRDQLLEYDVALALNNLSRTRTPKIGVLTPLLAPSNLTEPREGLSFLEELKGAYDVAVIPHFAEELPDGLDALLVVNASILRPEMLYAIDQHVMAGKGLIVAIDPRQRFNSSGDLALPTPSPEINDISDLLARYGISFDGSGIVGDAELASPVVAAEERQLSYPFWLRIGTHSLSQAHPVTANLNELLFAEPGALTVEPRHDAAPLVTTTAKSGTVPRAEFTGNPEAMAARFTPDGKPRVLAAVASGPYDSAFKEPPASKAGSQHRLHSVGRVAVFTVADADWLFDPMALQVVKSGGGSFTRPLNDNIAFLLNMAEFASGDARLLAIRTRGSLRRPFTRVAAMLAQSQAHYRDEEAELMGKIARIDSDIGKVLQVTGVERVEQLPADIRGRIRELNEKLLPSRRKLRQIRAAMRSDVERLGTTLTVLNLAAAPALAGIFALLMHTTRRRYTRRNAA